MCADTNHDPIAKGKFNSGEELLVVVIYTSVNYSLLMTEIQQKPCPKLCVLDQSAYNFNISHDL